MLLVALEFYENPQSLQFLMKQKVREANGFPKQGEMVERQLLSGVCSVESSGRSSGVSNRVFLPKMLHEVFFPKMLHDLMVDSIKLY